MRDSSYLSRPCCAAGAGLRVPALLLCQHETPRFFRPLPCICNTDTRRPHDTVRSDLTAPSHDGAQEKQISQPTLRPG